MRGDEKATKTHTYLDQMPVGNFNGSHPVRQWHRQLVLSVKQKK